MSNLQDYQQRCEYTTVSGDPFAPTPADVKRRRAKNFNVDMIVWNAARDGLSWAPLGPSVAIGTDDNNGPDYPYAVTSEDLHDAETLAHIELGPRVAECLMGGAR